MVPMGPQRAAASDGRGNARSICSMPAPRCPPHQRCLWYLLVNPPAPQCTHPTTARPHPHVLPAPGPFPVSPTLSHPPSEDGAAGQGVGGRHCVRR